MFRFTITCMTSSGDAFTMVMRLSFELYGLCAGLACSERFYLPIITSNLTPVRDMSRSGCMTRPQGVNGSPGLWIATVPGAGSHCCVRFPKGIPAGAILSRSILHATPSTSMKEDRRCRHAAVRLHLSSVRRGSANRWVTPCAWLRANTIWSNPRPARVRFQTESAR